VSEPAEAYTAQNIQAAIENIPELENLKQASLGQDSFEMNEQMPLMPQPTATEECHY